MKTIFHSLHRLAAAFLALPLALAMGACSSDDPEPELTFPDTQVLSLSAGATHSLSFTAEADWRLSSDQSWCKFQQADKTELSLSGKAGEQRVTLLVGDEGLTQTTSSVAHLTLYMQGQSGILAEITRSAAGYELKVFDADGQPTDVLTVGYDGYVDFRMEANFAFVVTSLPDWAELRGGYLTGAAGRAVESGLRIVPNGTVEKREQEGTLVVQDTKGQQSFTVRLTYAGMDRNAIVIRQPEDNAWNWKVSADGRTWSHGNNTYDRFIECTLSAYNDDYEIVMVEDTDDGLQLGVTDWLHYNDRTHRLTADATDFDRRAYVLAFPRATYDAMKDHLATQLFEEENGTMQLAYRFQQTNLVAHVTQQLPTTGGDDDSEVGFIALCFDENWEAVWIRCNLVKDDAALDRCEQFTSCRNLYLLDQPSPRGHYDQIRPWPVISDYDGLSDESAYFLDKDGNRIKDEVPELSFCDSESPSYWYIMGVHNTTEPMYLVLLDADGKQVNRVLLIDTKTK